MEEGKEGKVSAVRCINGILELEVEPAPRTKIFKYDPPTATRMTSHPLERVSLLCFMRTYCSNTNHRIHMKVNMCF